MGLLELVAAKVYVQTILGSLLFDFLGTYLVFFVLIVCFRLFLAIEVLCRVWLLDRGQQNLCRDLLIELSNYGMLRIELIWTHYLDIKAIY